MAAAWLAVGVGFLIAGQKNDGEADDTQRDLRARGGPDACSRPDFADACRTLRDDMQDRDRYLNVSTGGFIAAGVGVAALLGYAFLYEGSMVRPTAAIGPDHIVLTLGQQF